MKIREEGWCQMYTRGLVNEDRKKQGNMKIREERWYQMCTRGLVNEDRKNRAI
jgi:hypothetical protein